MRSLTIASAVFKFVNDYFNVKLTNISLSSSPNRTRISTKRIILLLLIFSNQLPC